VLKLLDASSALLATMDSPNSKQGPETLTWVSRGSGSFVLEIINSDVTVKKGIYTIKREASRTATEKDKRRVEVERVFVEGITASIIAGQGEAAVNKLGDALKGWQELGDNYLSGLTKQSYDITSDLLFLSKIEVPIKKGLATQKLFKQGTPASLLQARNELNEALKLYREFIDELNNRAFSKTVQNTTLKADHLLNAKWGVINSLSGIANTYRPSVDAKEKNEYLELAIKETDNFFSNKELQSSQYFDKAKKFLLWQQAGLVSGLAINQNLNDINPQYSLTVAQRALNLYQQIQKEGNIKDEAEVKFQIALTWNTIGRIHQKMDDFPQALQNLETALSIYRELSNAKSFEATILVEIALTYFQSFDYQKALLYLDQSLKIAESLNDKFYESQILGYLGIIYFDLGDEEKVRETAKTQLLLLLSKDYLESVRNNLKSDLSSASGTLPSLTENLPKESNPEGGNELAINNNEELFELLRLMAIGLNYKILGEYGNSLDYYNKALALSRAQKQISLESTILSNIGDIYIKQKNEQKAIRFFKQSLDIERQLPQKSFLAASLRDVGFAYLESGNAKESIPYLLESLVVWVSIGADKDQTIYRQYATTLAHIARAYKETSNTKLAILFGKLAVNATQRERQQLKSFDLNLQRSYLKKNEKPYHRLADWLIEEGRLPEAEQVLRILKEDEYFDYVRRDADEIKKLSARADLRTDERAALGKYELLAGKVTGYGAKVAELEELKKKLGTDFKQQAELEDLNTKLTDANAAFRVFLDKELVAEFSKRTKVDDKEQINIDRLLQNDLRQWGNGTVMLYTVAGEDRYRVILTTPKVQVDGKTEYKEVKLPNGKRMKNVGDLNQMISDFRDALQNPAVDPRPLGKQLYDILIKPIEKDLLAAQAKTLIWSLDGTLRYIPLAALSPDGVHYLVEKYQTVIITPKSRIKIDNQVNPNWRLLGAGVTKESHLTGPNGAEITFRALPGVSRELSQIVSNEDAKTQEDGLMVGKRLVDGDFNLAALENGMSQRTADDKRKYNVIHLATHFHLGINTANSFLLLGGNQALSLDKVSDDTALNFGDVELVALSACNTGFGTAVENGTASREQENRLLAQNNGAEVDSLATFIELRGAKSVLASLWAVADESTQLLMTEFYRLRKENPTMTKAAALQRAQQKLLAGKLKVPDTTSSRRDTSEMDAPATDYTHPYYWSPFILIGNWR
jgi:CHAT domain-containing protein/tetratricopeptide (TPR) repeat protein